MGLSIGLPFCSGNRAGKWSGKDPETGKRLGKQAGARDLLCENGEERWSRSKTLDRTRSYLNIYGVGGVGKYRNGTEAYEALCAMVEADDEQRIAKAKAAGKRAPRRCRDDAPVMVSMIVKPGEWINDLSARDQVRFFSDAIDCLVGSKAISNRDDVLMAALQNDEDIPHVHVDWVWRGLDGDQHIGYKFDAPKLAHRLNTDFVSAMQERGWDLDPRDVTDLDRLKTDPEYAAERKAKRKRNGRDANEYAEAQAAKELEQVQEQLVAVTQQLVQRQQELDELDRQKAQAKEELEQAKEELEQAKAERAKIVNEAKSILATAQLLSAENAQYEDRKKESEAEMTARIRSEVEGEYQGRIQAAEDAAAEAQRVADEATGEAKEARKEAGRYRIARGKVDHCYQVLRTSVGQALSSIDPVDAKTAADIINRQMRDVGGVDGQVISFATPAPEVYETQQPVVDKYSQPVEKPRSKPRQQQVRPSSGRTVPGGSGRGPRSVGDFSFDF